MGDQKTRRKLTAAEDEPPLHGQKVFNSPWELHRRPWIGDDSESQKSNTSRVLEFLLK